MKQPTVLLAASLAVAACGAASGPDSPAPGGAPAFAYAAPPGPLAYSSTDSMGMVMDAGPGATVNVDVVATTTSEFDFETQGDALLVTVRITSIDGRSTNSMGPTVTVGNEALPGPAVLRVEPDGEVTIVEEPEMPEALSQVAGSQSLYRRYFMRLPARSTERGEVWTDTIRISEDNDGLVSTTTSVVRSNWSRDTVVAGRTLRVIDSEMENSIHVQGTTQGVEIVQQLNGTASATTLWDPARHAIVERRESGTASGSTDLPAMGISGMPVSMRTRTLLRLRDGA